MNSRLLVDTSPAGLFLVHTDQEPVWPVESDRELAALAAVAGDAGASVQHVTGSPGPPTDGSEIVASFRADTDEAARLYAHLTKRRMRAFRDQSDLVASRPAVVVTLLESLHAELLSALYPHDTPGPAPGLICGANPGELRLNVLTRAAAASISGGGGRAVWIVPSAPASRIEEPDWTILGCDSDASDIMGELQRGAGLLSLVIHSDGVDGLLKRDLILCPMDRPSPDSDRTRSPRCGETGVCHRKNMPVQEALSGGFLVPPEAIRARILLLGTCWGTMAPDGAIDPLWGLTRRLLASPRLGAVLTPWTIAFVFPATLAPLARLLLAGVDAGEALACFHRSAGSRRSGLRMSLLGDPRVCLPSSAVHAPKPSRDTEARDGSLPPFGAPAGAADGNLKFLAAYLDADVKQAGQSTTEILEAGEAALSHVLQHVMAGSAVPDDDCRRPLDEMRNAVVDYVSRRGPTVVQTWSAFATLDCDHRSTAMLRCRTCGNQLTVFQGRFADSDLPERRVSLCPRCGLTEDAPSNSDLAISVVQGPAIHLTGSLPRSHWSASLTLKPQLNAELKSWRWPRDADGSPVTVFRPPEPWPVGPLTVFAVILHDTALTILSRHTRRSFLGTGPGGVVTMDPSRELIAGRPI